MRHAVLTVILALVSALACANLSIDNLQAGDLVRYPVVILRGQAEGPEMAVGTTWKNAVRFSVTNHRYAAIVELKPGMNMLLLHSGSETMKFRVDYKPITNPYRVLAVYITSSDGQNSYYSTNPHDKYPIREKLDLALKLIQGYTADSMCRAGYGPKTFSLELDKEGKVVVHFVRSPKSAAELRALDSDALNRHVHDVLKQELPEDKTKWCGILGFSDYDPIAKKAVGQIAIGSGCQALLGSASMQFWPNNLSEIPKVFGNSTLIDPSKTCDNSNSRRSVWANVSTAYGEILHELGHTFDLPQSPDRFSLMSRGFDFFSRSITSLEGPCDGHPQPTFFKDDELAHWDPFFAACLNYNPWFQADAGSDSSGDAASSPSIKFEGDDVVIDAPLGIRVVGTQEETIPSWFIEYKNGDPPKRLKLSRNDLRSKMQGTKLPFQIVVIDDRGQRFQIDESL